MATMNQTLRFSTRAAIKVPSFLKVGGANAIPEVAKRPMFEHVKSAMEPPKVPVQVRDRYGLPGALDLVTNPKLPEFLANPKEGFPARLIAKNADDMNSLVAAEESDDPALWARALKPHLDEMLPKHVRPPPHLL